jgi:hypothetical protein
VGGQLSQRNDRSNRVGPPSRKEGPGKGTIRNLSGNRANQSSPVCMESAFGAKVGVAAIPPRAPAFSLPSCSPCPLRTSFLTCSWVPSVFSFLGLLFRMLS